jgi:thiamine kinase-like enzyme
VLIDWEYAAAGEPLFDLAAVTRQHRLPKRAARYFLAAYFGAASAVPWEQMTAWEEVYERIVTSWMQRLARARTS